MPKSLRDALNTKDLPKRPFRFFGPIPRLMAEDMAERLLDENKLKETLIDFLSGEIEPQELAYEIQVHAENMEAYLAEGA